jgi:hypothetical protein
MESALRHFCRNQRCRSKLRTPVDNDHHAFCTPGCYEAFYRKRCLACEKPLRNLRRSFCPKPAKCANLVRRWPQKYRRPGYGRAGPESAHLTGLKSGLGGDRPKHRCLREWSWTESDGELELRDSAGAVLARLEHNRGRYRLTYPITYPVMCWRDLAQARHEVESIALGGLGLADIRPEKPAPHPLGAPKGAVITDGLPAGRITGGKGVDFDLPDFLRRRP